MRNDERVKEHNARSLSPIRCCGHGHALSICRPWSELAPANATSNGVTTREIKCSVLVVSSVQPAGADIIVYERQPFDNVLSAPMHHEL